MNATESIVAKFARELGCEVYHRGAPDFLLVRRLQGAKTIEIALVEVKSSKDKLHGEQENWQNSLREAGIPAATIRVSTSGQNEGVKNDIDALLKRSDSSGAWAEYIKSLKIKEFINVKRQMTRELEEARAEITFLKRRIAILKCDPQTQRAQIRSKMRMLHERSISR